MLESSDESIEGFLNSTEKAQIEWRQFHNQYSLLIKVLFEIINSFPSENKGIIDSLKTFSNSSFVDLYVQICSLINTSSTEAKKFLDYEHFQNLKKLLQLSSSSTFNEIVKKVLKVTSDICQVDYNAEFLIDIVKLNEILEKQINEQNLNHYNNQSDNEENIEEVLHISPKNQIQRERSISRKSKPLLDLNQELSPNKANAVRRRKTQTLGNLNLNRIKFIDWLSNQFSRVFDNDYTNTFKHSKHFCYSNISKLKAHLFVNQRISIHDGLVNPFKYFNTENTLKNSQDKDFLPISIIYKIYLECGHMINLYDWLQVSNNC